MIKTPIISQTLFTMSSLIKGRRERESRGKKRMWAPPRESRIRQAEAGISVYNTLGPRQALFIMGWTRVLEASGGSGPPKARVLWAPIGIDGVNRRAVSLRSLFAHEPRVVFRDNKRATSSSAGTTTPRSFAPFLSFSFFPLCFFPSLFSSSYNRALTRSLSSRLSCSLSSSRFPSSLFTPFLSFVIKTTVIAKFLIK